MQSATILIGHTQDCSQRMIVSLINLSPSAISRELRRNRKACGTYPVHGAQQQM
ncbi:helix-turn-helix domain-containing protein [Pseudomonas sp. CrR25]|nr:helix-turn-helix domain-containing protein [Pseudomonas sp. CrR25]